MIEQGVALDPPLTITGAADRAALFRLLADRDLDASYRLARAILGDASAAEDAVHDAFVTAWLKLASLRDLDRLEPWFHRILVNTCRDRLRQAARWRTFTVATDPGTGFGDPTSLVDDRDAVERAISTLGPDHRIILALRYYRDLPVDEIARVLGIPPGTVKSRLHHALRQMGDALRKTRAVEAAR